jgi:hypothetical protein
MHMMNIKFKLLDASLQKKSHDVGDICENCVSWSPMTLFAGAAKYLIVWRNVSSFLFSYRSCYSRFWLIGLNWRVIILPRHQHLMHSAHVVLRIYPWKRSVIIMTDWVLNRSYGHDFSWCHPSKYYLPQEMHHLKPSLAVIVGWQIHRYNGRGHVGVITIHLVCNSRHQYYQQTSAGHDIVPCWKCAYGHIKSA